MRERIKKSPGKVNKQESFKGVRKKIKQTQNKTKTQKKSPKKRQINHPERIGENDIKTNNTQVMMDKRNFLQTDNSINKISGYLNI